VEEIRRENCQLTERNDAKEVKWISRAQSLYQLPVGGSHYSPLEAQHIADMMVSSIIILIDEIYMYNHGMKRYRYDR
jgi:hypothetical protein